MQEFKILILFIVSLFFRVFHVVGSKDLWHTCTVCTYGSRIGNTPPPSLFFDSVDKHIYVFVGQISALCKAMLEQLCP